VGNVKFVTFNPYRTLGIPNTQYLKPELMFRHKDMLMEADVLLFPERWQVHSLVYGLKKDIFPSIQSIHLGYDKVEMTRALQMIVPEHVPYTLILGNSEKNIEKVLDEFYFPFIAKEVRNSMGKGVYLIENERQFRQYAQAQSVLYVQEYLPIDRDLRVVYVGDEVLCAYWRVGPALSHLNNVAQGGQIVYDFIPEHALELVRQVAQTLNINHAGFDIAIVDQNCYIFEFNVLFGHTGLQGLNLSIEQKITEYLYQAFSPNNPFHPLTPSPRAS
jgi:ribosomal protein S6--L-glutamate ligase